MVRGGGAVFNPMSSHTKDSKMVLDATLLNTQHYKVRINGKIEQPIEWCSALPYASVKLLLKKLTLILLLLFQRQKDDLWTSLYFVFD